MIDVTITGADDHVDIRELVDLSEAFPRVEWAILVASADRFGTPRYPSLEWISRFRDTPGLRRAMHVCGDASREFQLGAWDQGELAFARCQINGWTRASRDAVASSPRDFELVLQCRLGDDIAAASIDALVLDRASILLDASGGRGISPDWESIRDLRHTQPPGLPKIGFAGGIGPANVESVIRSLGPGRDYWLCMESGVRTDDRLDLKKVRDVLQTVQYCNARIEAEVGHAR